MPETSSGYSKLKERVAAIRKKFVQDQVDDESANPLTFEPDVERLAAFRLLVHAEIEEYIEKKARSWIKEMESRIESEAFSVEMFSKIYPIAMRLKMGIPFESPFNKDRFIKALKEIFAACKILVDENNGIKGDSFLLLSLLCGKNIDEIDDGLALLLSSYGKNRGDVAHKSTTSVRTIQAPSVEVNSAEDLVNSLGAYFYK